MLFGREDALALLCLVWLSEYLKELGSALGSVCLKTSTPIPYGLEGGENPPSNKDCDSYAFTSQRSSRIPLSWESAVRLLLEEIVSSSNCLIKAGCSYQRQPRQGLPTSAGYALLEAETGKQQREISGVEDGAGLLHHLPRRIRCSHGSSRTKCKGLGFESGSSFPASHTVIHRHSIK